MQHGPVPAAAEQGGMKNQSPMAERPSAIFYGWPEFLTEPSSRAHIAAITRLSLGDNSA